MTFKALASTALVASLSFTPLSPFVSPARADGKDVVAGLIIGGIIGSAIASENGKKKKSTSKSKKTKSKSTKSSAPSISPEQKAANIEVQQALNHFGWAVGTADGALGPKSKAAVKEYQAFMGFPVSGQLTDTERLVLVTAFHRAEAGGSAISEIVSSSVYGLRGVLIAQNDEMKGSGQLAAGPVAPGETASPAPGSVAAAAAAALPALLPAAPVVAETPTVTAPAAAIVASPSPLPAPAPGPAPESSVVATTPAPATPEPAAVAVAEPAVVAPAIVVPEPEPVPAAAPDPTGPGLPTFLDANGGKGPLAQHCASVAMASAGNGGHATAATMTDASFALAEQFCLARSAAVDTSKALTATIAGFTSEQISQQCAALAPALSEHVAAVSLKPQDAVVAGVEQFILTSGMSPAQLSGTAKVCLGVGYGEDQLEVAIGSALLLTALGETGYAELLGHHLSQGFGATARPDLAEGWYEVAVAAMAQGGAVFLTDMADRDVLILKAAYTLTGKAADLEPAPEVQEAALPSFVVTPMPEAEVPVAPVSAPVPPSAEPVVSAEGPGADAIRMGTEVAKIAAQAPLMLLVGN